jgi:hypothetical protein
MSQEQEPKEKPKRVRKPKLNEQKKENIKPQTKSIKQDKPKQKLMTVSIIEKYRMDLYRLYNLELYVDGTYSKTLLNEDMPSMIKSKYLINLNQQEFTGSK